MFRLVLDTRVFKQRFEAFQLMQGCVQWDQNMPTHADLVGDTEKTQGIFFIRLFLLLMYTQKKSNSLLSAELEHYALSEVA